VPAASPPAVPWLQAAGRRVPLAAEVTTVGRGAGCDLQLGHPTVAVLHAEVTRRGPYAYVTDLGLSVAGTAVNGTTVTRCLLASGDIISFGQVPCLAGGIAGPAAPVTAPELPRLSNRELDTLAVLCRTPRSPPPPRKLAAELGLDPAIIHLVLGALCRKLGVASGGSSAARRAALAARAIALGAARPGDSLPPGGRTLVYPVPPPPAGPAPGDAWIGSGQAARMLGVGLTTVHRWADKKGRIEVKRDPANNHRLYSIASITALMASQSRDTQRPVPDRVRALGQQPGQP
jgi:hypothetical protein